MHFKIGLIFALLLNLSSSAWADSTASNAGPAPSTAISPDKVIEIVVDALRVNDPEAGDDGIATVWRFAAPSNKAVTGPLERFTTMLKGSYGDMLNHIDSDYGPIEIKGNTAVQPVWLVTPTGDEVGYLFQLRKQTSGEFDGMWMTESVFPIAPKKRGTTI